MIRLSHIPIIALCLFSFSCNPQAEQPAPQSKIINISGNFLAYGSNKPEEGVGIALYQSNTLISLVETDASGEYSLTAVVSEDFEDFEIKFFESGQYADFAAFDEFDSIYPDLRFSLKKTHYVVNFKGYKQAQLILKVKNGKKYDDFYFGYMFPNSNLDKTPLYFTNENSLQKTFTVGGGKPDKIIIQYFLRILFKETL